MYGAADWKESEDYLPLQKTLVEGLSRMESINYISNLLIIDYYDNMFLAKTRVLFV